MVVELVGGNSIERLRSGLFSLDVAMSSHGDLGIPMGSPIELYGSQEVGKSTLAYYLAGTLGKGNISILDLDGADRDYLRLAFERSGFDGKVKMIETVNKKGARLHSECLNELGMDMKNPDYTVGILDSVSAYVPNAEAEGEIGDANVGRRAKDLANFSRMAVQGILTKSAQGIPSTCIVVNHAYAVIGGRGSVTAGGDALKFLAGVRMKIWNDEVLTNSKDKTDVLAFIVKGKVEKLRYGGKGREFKYVILPQLGVSRELTAMFDCFDLGLAERGAMVTVNNGELKIDYISRLVKAAREGHTEPFEVFFGLLQEYEGQYFAKHGKPIGEE